MKTTVLQIRLLPEDKQWLDAYAKKYGQTPSGLVRFMIQEVKQGVEKRK